MATSVAPITFCLLVLAVTLAFAAGLGWAALPFALAFLNETVRWFITAAAVTEDMDE